MPSMTPAERLRKRLITELNLDVSVDAEIRRQYKGCRSDGQWKWFLYPSPYGQDIGSPYPVNVLLKAKSLEAYKNQGNQIEILPK